MKTKTQIVFTTSVLAGFIGILLIAIRLPQKEKEQGVWINNWDIALWAVVGIGILALIAFGLRKFGTSSISWFPSWLKGLIAIAVIVGAGLWIYREWGSLEKGLRSVKEFADKAKTVSFTIDSLKERSWPNLLPSGRHRVSVSGGEYRFKCLSEMNYPSERSGFSDGKTPNTSSVGTGRIVAWSTTSANNPQGNGGEFIVGPGDTIFVKPEVSCQGKVFQTTEVSVQFSPMK